MITLSELLESGASLLSLEAENFEECGADDYSRQAANEAKALRAITPALVDVIAELQHHAEHGWHDHCDKTMCRACVLASAMKEAGVTCE